MTRNQQAAYRGAASLRPEPPRLVLPPPLPTRRSWWSRLVRFARAALLRYEIDSAERWLIECERDGIYDTDTLRTLRNHLATQRVRLIDLEAS